MLENPRIRGIIKTLLVCLAASTVGASVKVAYGVTTSSLAFFADGIHSFFDSAATIVGMVTVVLLGRPPDDSHPYGHQKFETIAAIVLAILLFLAAYEVGSMAYTRILQPDQFPQYSHWGLLILGITMGINLWIAKFEGNKAKELDSPFLASDAIHNKADFWVTLSVFASVFSVQFRIPYIDAAVAILIACYLVYLSFGLIKSNLDPLVDRSVLDAKEVESIANSVKGVLHCHAIRSRGQSGHHFLDLNIHLPGTISLHEAHEITHTVELKLKTAFPSLVDVVIHTEPDGHPPCSKEG